MGPAFSAELPPRQEGDYSMSTNFNFERLVELCQRTDEETRRSAARAIDRSLVARNWLFGWYIVEYEQRGADRAKYGTALIRRLASKLGIRGCSSRNLALFRKFYRCNPEILQTVSAKLETGGRSEASSDGSTGILQSADPANRAIVQTVSAQLIERFTLGWSHYVTLLSVDDGEARRFYEIEAAENGWSVRELRRQIDSSLYQRLALSRDKQEVQSLACKGQKVEKPSDVIKNPYVLEFLGLDERPAYSETDMEAAIISRLEQFLLELGKGFLFEARQKRFSFDDSHFFVDLVFYNRLLRCYVLIDLKLGKLSHQDLGQMQMYVNYFDRHVKTEEELPTIGILLCDDKNDAVVELTLPGDANIYASKYQLYLPSKQELATQLENVRRELEAGNGETGD